MSENSEMTCAELADVAAELALGVLTGRERAMAVAHLDTCDACREDVRQLMATGDQLVELLPPAEPPAGFETRVLGRLGLPTPPLEPVPPRQLIRRDHSPGHRRAAHGAARPDSGEPGGGRPPAERTGNDRPRRTRPPGRLRRTLSVAAVALAIIVAGFGGWRIGAGTSPTASTAPGALTTASLLSATRQSVGNIFLYSGTPRWLFMSVNMGSGDGAVTCQLVGANGQVHTLGSFQLADGYGWWGTMAPSDVGEVQGARLISASGAILATATFAHR